LSDNVAAPRIVRTVPGISARASAVDKIAVFEVDARDARLNTEYPHDRGNTRPRPPCERMFAR
jgi:hypothetical protein